MIQGHAKTKGAMHMLLFDKPGIDNTEKALEIALTAARDQKLDMEIGVYDMQDCKTVFMNSQDLDDDLEKFRLIC